MKGKVIGRLVEFSVLSEWRCTNWGCISSPETKASSRLVIKWTTIERECVGFVNTSADMNNLDGALVQTDSGMLRVYLPAWWQLFRRAWVWHKLRKGEARKVLVGKQYYFAQGGSQLDRNRGSKQAVLIAVEHWAAKFGHDNDDGAVLGKKVTV